MLSLTAPKLSPNWSRWILIGTIVVMGAALLVTVWVTYSGVRDASAALVRGRAAALQADLREEFRALENRPTNDDLQAIVDTYFDEGLHYIALIRKQELVAVGGTSVLTDAEVLEQSRSLMHAELATQEGRVQMVLRSPGPRPGRRRSRVIGKRSLPNVFIEFEPKEANALQASSSRSLAAGAGAAVLLWLTAIFLLRWFAREDRQRQRLESDRRLASLGQMSAVLAHEIRNPLSSLKGNAQLLEKLVEKSEAKDHRHGDGDAPGDQAPSKVVSKAQRVVSEAIRLEHLVNDLLEFARSGEIQRAEVDPAQLLQESADTFETSIIAIDSSSAPARWSLDAARMQQVLNNLLQNATQASERVEAKVSLQAGTLVFVVRDHGEGIAEGSAESLFEPFHTKKTQGTGLGLSVAKRLVELHGGSITARNAEGGGAEFRVKLPAG